MLRTPYQYTEAQLAAAVDEADRLGTFVGVHAMGEPGTLLQAGVASVFPHHRRRDHAPDAREGIFAVPTFTIFEFCDTS